MEKKSEQLLLGIDIGTTDAKCTFYDLNGYPVASRYKEYAMIHTNPGWAEEDPNQWWQAVKENLHWCIAEKNIDTGCVAGIGISCTNAFFPVDRQGNPMHNALLQIDQRTKDEVTWIEDHIGREEVYNITGNRIARGTFSMPTLRWFYNHRPDVIKSTYKFLTPSGFIVCKLTDEFTINESRMGVTLLSDIRSGTWDKKLIEKAGIDIEKLPTPCKAYEIVGYVTEQAAEETGLKAGIPVVGGAMDTVAAAVGAGAVSNGDIFLAMGTCGRLCFTGSGKYFDSRLMNCRNAFDNQYLSIEATNASGASLRWFRDCFGSAALLQAEKEGKSTYHVFDDLAEQAKPGASGLIYLPYLSGERCPIWDPDARGVFFGLNLSTSYSDMVRAVMEGVAFSMREGVEIVLKYGDKAERISLGGGVANSRIWCQIFADVLGYPIIKLDINETETLGDAILAGIGVGLISRPKEFALNLLERGETIYPNTKNKDIYDKLFELYRNLYKSLKNDFKMLSEINSYYR